MENLKSIKSPTRFYKVVDAVNVTHNSKVDKYPDDIIKYIVERDKSKLLDKSELLDCKNALENLDVWDKSFWGLSVLESISAVAVPAKNTKKYTLEKIDEILTIS